MRFSILFLVLLSQNALSNEQKPSHGNSCSVNSPRITTTQLPAFELDNQQQVYVTADKAQITYPDKALFSGNVNFRQGDKVITADHAKYNELDNLFSAAGDLFYQDDALTLLSDSLTTSLDGNNTQLLNTKYWFNGTLAHGTAESFIVDEGRYLTLSNAQFTTCPDDQPDWSLNAKEIRIDSEKDWATVRQATLEVFDIPVFYFPYLTLPVSDKRSSGFLYPTIGSNTRNGVEIATPYYWNIAPEYDMTFIPRIMTDRGVQLNTEFRYLTGNQQGTINVEYLAKDRSKNNDSRYLIHWAHGGSITDDWRISSDFTHVSDDNYFNDVGSPLANKTDNQLIKNIELSYYQPDWWFNFKVQNIQVLGETRSPYKLLPQISLHSYQNPLSEYLEYDVFSELSIFKRSGDVEGDATRLHLEPTLRLPLNYASGSLTSEITLMQTWYEQTNEQGQDSSINRSLSQFRVHGIVNFERDFSDNMVQTLEPQIQYLKVPYKDQSNIRLYDTALLRDDYHGLFRARRFSGLDRIADTDQVTLGVTTRLKDRSNHESLKLSLGQTFYLKDSEMALAESNITNQLNNRSALAGELDFTFNKHWSVSQAIQFSNNQSDITQSRTAVDFRLSHNKLVQFSHRYVKNINDTEINQLGLQGVWPINDTWTVVGNYYRDTNLNRTIESFIGLQYESCCWAIRVQGYRQLLTQFDQRFTTLNQEQFDSGISFSFQIRGLGANKKQRALDMLNDGLFTYRRPYYLKD